MNRKIAWPTFIVISPRKNCRWFLAPTHVPTTGQWWSILDTHRLQTRQCFDRSGRAAWHDSQNFPTCMSFPIVSSGAFSSPSTSPCIDSSSLFSLSIIRAALETRRMHRTHSSRSSVAVAMYPGPNTRHAMNKPGVATKQIS